MKLVANYHTHTELCKHATGKPIDYALQAHKEGCCQALGFSDHCPYPDSVIEKCWPQVRMTEKEIPLYTEWVQIAQKSVTFPIYMGFECEWDKHYETWYKDLKDKYGAQYLVLGSHWFTVGTEHFSCTEDIHSAKDLTLYTNQTIQGMQSGLFAFLAHPDLFMRTYCDWNEQSKACLRAILDAAIDLQLPLEINGLGMSRKPIQTARGTRYQYPFAEFWEMVAETSVPVICSSDAHSPDDVIFNTLKAHDFAGRFAITPIKTLQFS